MSRFLRLLPRIAVIVGLGLQSRASFADSPNAAQTPPKKKDYGQVAIVDAEPPAETLPAKRAVPDYDGRGEKPTTQDGLLWIPRIIAAPFYFFTEYLLR